MMQDQSRELLLAEFDSAWKQILNIDNRRGIYFNYFNVAFSVALTFSAAAWTKGVPPSLLTTLSLSATFFALAYMAHAIKGVLMSERNANVNYRRKINLIRELLLVDDGDPKVQEYLKRKDIGIKTDSGIGNDIDKVGGSLKAIFALLALQQAVLIVFAFLIWTAYLGWMI